MTTSTLVSFLRNLRDYLEKLHFLAELPKEELLSDFTKIESAKYLLQVSIQTCIDIANHIIAEEDFDTPNNYYDAFVELSRNEIIPTSFLPTLKKMVDFRNRVVHLYWIVDEQLVSKILQENLGDFETFTQYILDFTEAD